MTALRPGARRAGALAFVALAVAGVTNMAGVPSGPNPGLAGDRYRAGEPVSLRSELTGAAASRAAERALGHARALGIPTGTRARAARVVDRFAGTMLDEVVTTDAAGRRLGIFRLEGTGRIVMAVRLGWRERAARRVDAAGARSRAARIAAAAGLHPDGPGAVGTTAEGGWRVSWLRRLDGVPVVGDGMTVTLFADGTLHAVAVAERPLAEAPATTLERAAAERIAWEHLGVLLGTSRTQARIVDAHLAWVAPNDTFEAAAPDAPGPVLHLAWVVEARTAGSLAERLRALELYLDAGDGGLIGGDLLR